MDTSARPPSLPPSSFVQVLRGKAEARNPDEFYFAMEKARTKDGVHVVSTSEPNRYSQEELRLMKTQDVGYLTLKAQAEAKVIWWGGWVDGGRTMLLWGPVVHTEKPQSVPSSSLPLPRNLTHVHTKPHPSPIPCLRKWRG